MTLRRHAFPVTWRHGVLASSVMLGACATGGSHIPRALQGYEVLVPGRDTTSHALAVALRDRGLRVRREVRGGGRPTAALILFTFRDPPATAGLTSTWLHARLFDTRSGAMLGAAMLRLDSLGLDARGRALLLVDSLLLRSVSPEPSP